MLPVQLVRSSLLALLASSSSSSYRSSSGRFFLSLSNALGNVVAYHQLHKNNKCLKMSTWSTEDPQHADEARTQLNVWPLDEYNAKLLNEVHPREYKASTDKPHDVYDLIAIGAGAGGLVSSKQSARRGAKSCMISENLAGGGNKYKVEWIDWPKFVCCETITVSSSSNFLPFSFLSSRLLKCGMCSQ